MPPFTEHSAIEKVRLLEDTWNSRDPEHVSLAYSKDAYLRSRNDFIHRRRSIVEFLHHKWAREINYRLIVELWAFHVNRIAVRCAYEWSDGSVKWYRSYGNESWEFNENGLMQRQFACASETPIKEAERRFYWPLGRRPDDHPGLTDLSM